MSTIKTIDPAKIPASLAQLAVPIDGLNHYGKNARIGSLAVIMESLEILGQYRPVVVRTGTNEILAGNNMVKAARELGWRNVAATFVDVDDDEAARIVLVDNRANDLATYDDEALVELLQSLDGDTAATGYADEDIDELLAALNAADDDPMPGEDRDRDGDDRDRDDRDRDGQDRDRDGGGGNRDDDESGDWEGEGMRPGGAAIKEGKSGSLVDRFGVPPFTVLDTRAGYWQDRRKRWTELGIESELGRAGELGYSDVHVLYMNWYPVKALAEKDAGRELSNDELLASPWADKLRKYKEGKATTSIFDPALCELLYRWHTSEGDAVLDPWAGGSVRGVVAGSLGRQYLGIDLREVQVEANRAQADLVHESEGEESRVAPEWIAGDSTATLQHLAGAGTAFDFLIGCPPYYDLEKYSDDPLDLSNMTHADFDAAMHRNIAAAAAVLRQDRFAAVVVGSVRDRKGHILDMRKLMVDAFTAAGMHLVNDAVLLNMAGGVAIRAARPFQLTRTLSRTHQDVLIFVKGNRKVAAQRLGELDISTSLDAAAVEAETEVELAEGESVEEVVTDDGEALS